MSTVEDVKEKKDEKKPKKSFFSKIVADKLRDQLLDGNSPMQRSGVQNVPYNPCNGKSYNGINALNLMMESGRDPRWMEFNEANNAGYKVKEGAKGTPIIKFPKKEPGQDQKFQITYLYNAEQLDFCPPMHKKPDRPDPYERVSTLLQNCGATVIHDQKERAFYHPGKDEIHLPKPESCQSINKYCQDALNAYFHSTGHPSRLNRDTFDSPKKYQQNAEELICAVSTTMMCADLGIPGDPTKNAELTSEWADTLKDYPIQFSQYMQAAEQTVSLTLLHEQRIAAELDPQENQAWRPVAEASPAIAVRSFLTQKEVLTLADQEPEKVNRFEHQGTEIFTMPGTGYALSKTEIDTPGQSGKTMVMTVKTEGYDRAGNTYDVVMEGTVRRNDSGLLDAVKPPEAKRIYPGNKEMTLPLDWDGKITVATCHEDESGNLQKGRSEDFPEFHGAYASGKNGDVLLAAFDREKQAAYYANLVERQFKYQQERPQSQQRQAAQETPEKGQEVAAEPQNSQANPAPQEQEAAARPEPEQRQADAKEAEQSERSTTQQEQEARSEREQVEESVPEREEPDREQPAPEQDKEQARQEAKEKIAERLTEEKMDADKAAKRVAAMVKRFDVPKDPTPYMHAKGVGLMPGTYQNKTSTCIPLYNVDGELRSMAYADKDGKKNFAKGTDRSGCAFYDKKAVEKSNVVGFAVGAATSATVSRVFNDVPVVATMDAANLPVVVAAFKEKYPDKQQVIFANNNQSYEAEKGRNPGKYYAEQAAKKTGALVVSPRFASDEKSKDFVDFNDLANKSKYGKEAVKDQCESAIEKAKTMAAEQAKKKEQEKERGNKELGR